jgi:hypothetical protein
MLDGIKSAVTVIAPKTAAPGALDVRSGSVPLTSEFARAARK